MEEIINLGERLSSFYERFSQCFRTQTRDTSGYGLKYISGLLRMETDRNLANVGRKTETSGQNLQHFVSNSSWAGERVIVAVEEEVKVHPAFQEALLVLDESAEEKAGEHSAGAGRQHNGRLGKIEMSQVGVFLALVTPEVCTWIDGELYLPKAWFEESHAELRNKTGVPEKLTFQTKPELGWQLIQRTRERQIPFQAVVMDDLYGRNETLRQNLNNAQIEYYGDVPSNTKVYLEKPQVLHPLTKRGEPSQTPQIVGTAYEVREVRQKDWLEWHTLRLRANERGFLEAKFARVRVWVVYDEQPRQEWLLLRQDAAQITYILSNAPESMDLNTMAWRKTHRYLIERSNEDAKDEFGWDEFQTRKYRAWKHQLALTILASWFVAETRLDWLRRFQQSPELMVQYEVDALPKLSVANVRELLRASLPLPQLSPEEAASLVVSHLVNRTRSRKSRLRRKSKVTTNG
ncbi:MAG TPA: IS701 family transposase [Methylomicrobium sp.]|nr:IS701 family transposase [Methylomicrobium sp.]